MQTLEDLDFTDDVSLLSHTVGHKYCLTRGLEINITKTKSMRINANLDGPLTVNGQAIEELDCFTCLSSIASNTGGPDEVIKARINKAH